MNQKKVREAHAKAILKYLQRGFRLSQRKAIIHWNCYRLSARIFDLIAAGHDIKCEIKYNKDAGTKWGEYFIPEFHDAKPPKKVKSADKKQKSVDEKTSHLIQASLFGN